MTTQSIARLDRTQPPPGYTLTPSCGVWVADEGGALIREDESFDGEASAIAAAWSHYERERDPPGMVVWLDALAGDDVWWWGDENRNYGPEEREEAEARAAAWAWYWRRVALAARVDAEVVVLVEYGDGGTSSRVPTPRGRVADALRPMLTMADDEDARLETAAEVERLFSEGRLSFEGDPPIELAAVGAWPRAITWPDEQVSAVERWLAEGGELPEVLCA